MPTMKTLEASISSHIVPPTLMPPLPDGAGLQQQDWVSFEEMPTGVDTFKCRMNGCQNYGIPPVGTMVYVCDSCIDEIHNEIEHESAVRRQGRINA